jgi:hypothetical protein
MTTKGKVLVLVFGDGEKLRDADPLPRGHLIALLVDLYAAHLMSPFPIDIR